ncbi:MAG: AlkZ family DNA glycosylase [Micrococcales bacterium]|nr:AlkZ family DNA glycosylase [Micrococcales bacterium]
MTRAFTADHRRLTALRLEAQRIARPEGDPAAVVGHLLALQAQDYPGALWSVGLRCARPDRAAVERELEEGDLVRSWPLRGTLHLIDRRDLGWLLQLTAERIERSVAARHRALGLDERDIARAAAIVDERLDGARLGRRDLLGALADGGIPTDGQRGAHLLGALARRRRIVLCSSTRWARWADRIGPTEPVSREDALDALALRYFTGHGPATARDLAWWSGLPLGEIRPAIERVRERLETMTVDGVEYLHRPGLVGAVQGAYALPGFDEYVLGYGDRRAPLAGAPLERVVPGGNGMFLPTIVIDGEIVATWRRSPPGSGRVVLDTPGPVPRRRAPAVRAALRRWGRFTGQVVEAEV